MNSPTGRILHRIPMDQYLKQSIAAQKQSNHLRKDIIEAGDIVEGDIVDWSSADFSQLERRAEAHRKNLDNEDQV